jgi:hypothetical protein
MLLSGKWDEYMYSCDDIHIAHEFYKHTDRLIDRDNLISSSGSSSSSSSSISSSTSKKKSQSSSKNKSLENKFELLWRSEDSHLANAEFYHFNNFTFQLNELYDEQKQKSKIVIKSGEKDYEYSIGPLPITDCRYRPDMKLCENGDVDEAAKEKNRLEEKQRETRKQMENGDLDEWKPLWFEKTKHFVVKNQDTWLFNDHYWNRDYSKCPNIF